MTSAQKVKLGTAIVDAVILIVLTVIALVVKDEHTSTVLAALFVGLQPLLVTMVVALTSTENTAIRAEASKFIAERSR